MAKKTPQQFQLILDAGTREGLTLYQTLYLAMCSGGAGERRGPDVLRREMALIQKLQDAGEVAEGVDVESLAVDAIVPYQLQETSSLLLTEIERKMLKDCIENARWPANMSAARLAAMDALDHAERVEPSPATIDEKEE